MPRYYFTIRLSNREEADQHGTLLEDDAGALDHACRIVREVQAGTGYDCARLVIVGNDKQEMVLTMPFPLACA